MAGRFAIDFGTSNTVLAVWDEHKKQSQLIALPEFNRLIKHGQSAIPIIPSLIHYTEDNRQWIGQQVIERNLYHSRHTFRWMKRYISQRSPIKVQLENNLVSPFSAGRDFLTILMQFATQQLDLDKNEEIAFSVPVESYEHYEEWLASVAEGAGIPRFRLIDEPSAAALGYGTHLQPGQVVLVFDFGGGTMHASMVLMDVENGSSARQRCRVLGKAGKFIGGASIDQWILQDLLTRHGRSPNEENISKISNKLLIACEKAKETLSIENSAALALSEESNQEEFQAMLTRSELEETLDHHGLYTAIGQTLRSALNFSRERGYEEQDIHSVLLIGGSCAIPSVQRSIRQMFGKDKVFYDRPFDAVASGAAAFVAGVDFFDHIQHNYAIRYIHPQHGGYDYRVIVKRGTPYPTQQAIAKMVIKPSYDGQQQLGLAIFEMSDSTDSSDQGVELIFDQNGTARIAPVTPHEIEQRRLFWMNEAHLTFLPADPPGKQGEPRFEVEFGIDANKRLIFTARDLVSGHLTHKDFPVVKLT